MSEKNQVIHSKPSKKIDAKKRIALIYFSGTGNTKAITDLLTQHFSERASVFVFKVEEILKGKESFNSRDYDLIGLGHPIYGFDTAKPIYEFVKTLNKEKGKKIFLYYTCAGPFYLNSISTLLLKRKLNKIGFIVFYERIFYMPSNIFMPYNDELCKQLYNAAIPKTKQMADNIINEKLRLRKDPFIVRIFFFWLYLLERIGWKFIAKDYKIAKSCTRCKICINNCPRENIFLKKSKIRFKMRCIGCYRCVYSCPENAIKGRLYNFAILKKGYNIHRIIANDELKGDYISSKTKGYFRVFINYLSNVDL